MPIFVHGPGILSVLVQIQRVWATVFFSSRTHSSWDGAPNTPRNILIKYVQVILKSHCRMSADRDS